MRSLIASRIIYPKSAGAMHEKILIKIPDGLDFADLKLARDPHTGAVEFEWAPIERVCKASELDVALFRDGPEDNISGLIVAWHFEHRADGGATDAVAEDLILETLAEDARGGGISHPPGRA